MNMDGAMSVGRRPADRECVGGRRSVSLPSRYIEELENCSSPGVVSKKAAFFEEVIRSASSEKCPPSTNRKTGLRSMDRVDEAVVPDHADVTARTLDFSSDSELHFGSKEIEQDLASELGAGISEDAIRPEQCDSSCVDNESSVSEPFGENLHFGKLDETELADDGLCHGEIEKVFEGGDNLGSLGRLETQSEVLKENKDPHHDEKELGDSALPHANSLEAKQNPGSSASMSKVPVTQKRKLPTRASTTSLEKQKAAAETLREGIITKRGVPRSLNPVSRSTNFTVPQPFALATDKRKSVGGRLVSENTRANLTSTAGSADESSTRKSQVGTKTASRQSLKDPHSNGKPEGQAHKKPTSPTSKSAKGIPRCANGFHLKSDERAEKRKEFYTKLEERVTAREHERNQIKAKTQEETEAELRKLRESLRFKAKPLPSFYHEMPQTKNDVKKAPTTRAISPRLGRPKCNLAEGSHIRLCQQQTPSGPARAGAVSIKKNSPEKASGLSSSSEGGPKCGKLPTKISNSRTSIEKHSSSIPVNVAKVDVSEVPGIGVPSMLDPKGEDLVNGNDPEVGLSSEDCFDLKEEDDLLPGYGTEADIERSSDEVLRSGKASVVQSPVAVKVAEQL